MHHIRMYLLLFIIIYYYFILLLLLLLLLLLSFGELGKRFFSSFVSSCYYDYDYFFLLNVVASLRWLITVDSCAPLREGGTFLRY